MSTLVTVRLGNDLRVLLRIMFMCLDSLKQRYAADGASDRDFVELEGAIDSAFHISRELLALGRPPTIERSVVDVNELVSQLENVLARMLGSHVQMSLKLDALDPMVEAEAVQLEWVLLNLAANSRDAMPNGGSFAIRTASVDRHIGTPPRPQRFIRLTITDSGHGLFGDAQARAFEPFFSTKDSNAGLGLTSVAMIIRSFQGWLHIEGDRAGTSIHIHLPALAASSR